MPVLLKKVNGVQVSTPDGVKAKETTREKAEAQARLLRAVEKTSWRPTGKPMARRFKRRRTRPLLAGRQ